jgi:hypothetical protein
MRTNQRNITLEEANNFKNMVEVRFNASISGFVNNEDSGPAVEVLRKGSDALFVHSPHDERRMWMPLKHLYTTEIVSTPEVGGIPKEGVTPKEVVRYLNRALQIDPEAINKLFRHCVPVNEALPEAGDDIPIVLSKEGDGSFTLAVLGLINAMFPFDEEKGGGSIVAVWNENGLLKKFRAVTLRGR